MEQKKVYCKDCAFFAVIIVFEYRERCNAPENMEDTYRAPKSHYKREAKEINANNDCIWFQEKGYDARPEKKSPGYIRIFKRR